MAYPTAFCSPTRRSEMWEALQFDFVKNALAAGILTSVICGVVGTLVVVNRIVFISGGSPMPLMEVSALPSIWGFPLPWSDFVFPRCIHAYGRRQFQEQGESGYHYRCDVGYRHGSRIILIELSPGYSVDLMSFLFGSILSVPRLDIWYMCGLALGVIVIVAVFYREFIAMSYDEEFAAVAGVPVRLLYFTLLGLISLSVVMIIRVVGLILVIALLTIPPYIAEKYVKSLGRMMIVASCLGILFTLTGLWVSYLYNLTSGATIIMVGGVGFFLSLALDAITMRMKLSRQS